MSTNVQLSGASYAQPRPGLSVGTAPALKPEAKISEFAKDKFAKNAEVGADLQSLHQSIEAAVGRLNEMMKDTGRDLNIGIDKALGSTVVTVRNAESGEVVRQIPNEVVVKMAHSIEAFKGWLHDGNA